jgi:chromosomal replication initiation ATPase DnaA
MAICAGKNCRIIISLQARILELETALGSGPFPNRATCTDITAATAAYYGLKPEDLLRRRQTSDVCQPRMMAMYLTRILTQASLTTIGRHFNKKDHTTVLHAIRKIETAKCEIQTAIAIREIGAAIAKIIKSRSEYGQES